MTHSKTLASILAAMADALAASPPDWTKVSDHWLELSLQTKETSLEGVVAWLGHSLQLRDDDQLREGIAAFRRRLEAAE